jgi:hypothetical protein
MSNRLIRKCHLAFTLTSAARCSPTTFRSWRHRNGLLPDANEDGGWGRYSLADIAAARTVTVLTGLGLSAQVAVDAAMKALQVFEQLATLGLTETSQPRAPVKNILAIFPTGQSECFERTGDVVWKDAEGYVVINAIEVFEFVKKQLADLCPDMMTSDRDAEVIANSAMAAAWASAETEAI